jgi:hypothetical protein
MINKKFKQVKEKLKYFWFYHYFNGTFLKLNKISDFSYFPPHPFILKEPFALQLSVVLCAWRPYRDYREREWKKPV